MYYTLRQGFLKFMFVALAYGKWQAVNEFLLLKQKECQILITFRSCIFNIYVYKFNEYLCM